MKDKRQGFHLKMRQLKKLTKQEIKQIRLEAHRAQDEELSTYLPDGLSPTEYQKRRQNLRDLKQYHKTSRRRTSKTELTEIANLPAEEGQKELLRLSRRAVPLSVAKKYARFGENQEEPNHFDPSPWRMISNFYFGWMSDLFKEKEKPTPRQETLYRERYHDFFGSDDRLYFPIGTLPKSYSQEPIIAEALEAKGYHITDYSQGFATDTAGKQNYKIGKLLKDNSQLSELFRTDPTRLPSNRFLVLSRHPYDIARASNDRGWISCLDPNHESSQINTLKNMTLHGGVICYLVTEQDLNISNPLCRTILMPHQTNHGETVLLPDLKSYGIQDVAFDRMSHEIADLLNQGKKSGQTSHYPDIYYNGAKEGRYFISAQQDASEFLSMMGLEVFDMGDGKLHAKGTLDFADQMISQIPDLSHVTFEGDLILRGCNLTSLDHLPEKVIGTLDISNNPIGDLVGCPKEVDGNFIAQKCQLKSLKGIPQYISGNCDLAVNELSSFKHMPDHIGNDLNITSNNYTSFEGCPQNIGGSLRAIANKLTTLKGCPEHIHGTFSVRANPLNSLEHGPKEVDGGYDCTECQLTSLQYVATYIGRSFEASENQIKTMSYLPDFVGKDWNLSKNQITQFENLPETAYGSVDFSNNPLKTLNGFFKDVHGSVDLSECGLSSMSGFETTIKGNLSFKKNRFTSFEGMPQTVIGNIDLSFNNLQNFNAFPTGLTEHQKISLYQNEALYGTHPDFALKCTLSPADEFVRRMPSLFSKFQQKATP